MDPYEVMNTHAHTHKNVQQRWSSGQAMEEGPEGISESYHLWTSSWIITIGLGLAGTRDPVFVL